MVRQRFEHLEPERQEGIIQAAAEEFSARGYEAASVNRIIARAGFSKGSLYYYFEDKSDLFSTVMERATTLMVRLVGGISLDSLTAESYWPTFEGMMRRSADRLTANAWYVRLARAFYRAWGRGGERGPAGRVFQWMRGWARDILGRGQRLGVVRTDLPLDLLVEMTLALGQATDRWMLDTWDAMNPDEREAMIVAQMGVFRRLLEPQGGAAR